MLILASIGATFIVTRSYLFEDFRNLFINNEILSTLVNCPQCFGFWCCFVFSFFLLPITDQCAYETVLLIFGSSFATSGICYITNEMIEK